MEQSDALLRTKFYSDNNIYYSIVMWRQRHEFVTTEDSSASAQAGMLVPYLLWLLFPASMARNVDPPLDRRGAGPLSLSSFRSPPGVPKLRIQQNSCIFL
jgi:hypothetical protein